MVAHSLGNMLVSAARQFHGLQYEKYFMLNAAVPLEAYDPVGGVTAKSKIDMTPPEWRQYPDRVRATHWYELFSSLPNDARTNLTWKGIFKDVDKTINFYSSMDEVVANGGDVVKELLSRSFAWYNQERYKGYYLVSFSPQAGWVFNGHYLKEVYGGELGGEPFYTYRRYTPEETVEITDESLMVHPFFKNFADEGIYGDGGSELVRTNSYVRWYALSHGIPAESFAAGANPVPQWGVGRRNVDMAITRKSQAQDQEESSVEPDGDSGDDGNPDILDQGQEIEIVKRGKWVHSYFIEMSLFETKELYERLVNEINKRTKGDGNE
jgi:hypothetical protein